MRSPEAGTSVLISSGLGNQLFQLSASIYLNGGARARLLALGNERQHIPGYADVSGFALGDDTEIVAPRATSRVKLARKLLGETQTFYSRAPGESDLRRKVLAGSGRILAPSLLVPELGPGLRIRAAVGIGYDQAVTPSHRKDLWLGFFQSWKYSQAEEVARLLGGPAPAMPCSWFDLMAYRAIEEQPLIVHVRLGDYRHIPGAGIPNKEYYRRALFQATEAVGPESVWLFSDEPDAATTLLPTQVLGRPVEAIVPPTSCSHPATVLSVMSKGTGFVTANSTFSYWAARLSGVGGDHIFVPDPWFPGGPTIRDMIPEDWRRIPRSHSD